MAVIAMTPSLKSITALKQWLQTAPKGTTVDTRALLEIVNALPQELPAEARSIETPVVTWQVPHQTRLRVPEVAEALGRPVSFVYRHTSTRSGYSTIPHRRLDGELVFVADDVREWIKCNEER